MSVGLMEQPMAKKTSERPKRNDVAVKIDAEVVRKSKIIAAYRGITLAEFISSTLSPIVERVLDQEQKKVAVAAKKKAN